MKEKELTNGQVLDLINLLMEKDIKDKGKNLLLEYAKERPDHISIYIEGTMLEIQQKLINIRYASAVIENLLAKKKGKKK